MQPTADTTRHAPWAMHVSLQVSDLERSLAFYRALFGLPPAKVRADYAKFELERPPLVLSLLAAEGAARAGRGTLSHLGWRLPDDDALEAERRRIQAAGLAILSEEPGVTCCYAVQDKFWVADPDGHAWEWYRFLADAEPAAGAPATACADDSACCATTAAEVGGCC